MNILFWKIRKERMLGKTLLALVNLKLKIQKFDATTYS
jgi:hypothetical protein